MIIKEAVFVKSSQTNQDCPTHKLPEYAFIGRSNVGKSSLINMLTGRKSLAKTSGKPGKTRLINHFLINEDWYLVDLPGYGYASASKSDIKKWATFIDDYILNRKNLLCTFVLIDSRLPLQKIDLDFMSWLADNQIAFSMIFTKVDKSSKTKQQSNFASFKKEFLKYWAAFPPYFFSSAENGIGRDEILGYIEYTNGIAPSPE